MDTNSSTKMRRIEEGGCLIFSITLSSPSSYLELSPFLLENPQKPPSLTTGLGCVFFLTPAYIPSVVKRIHSVYNRGVFLSYTAPKGIYKGGSEEKYR